MTSNINNWYDNRTPEFLAIGHVYWLVESGENHWSTVKSCIENAWKKTLLPVRKVSLVFYLLLIWPFCYYQTVSKLVDTFDNQRSAHVKPKIELDKWVAANKKNTMTSFSFSRADKWYAPVWYHVCPLAWLKMIKLCQFLKDKQWSNNFSEKPGYFD